MVNTEMHLIHTLSKTGGKHALLERLSRT